MIFETGTVYSDDPDTIFRIKDIEEMTGHFKMFNYTLNHLDEPLSETLICGMHRNLKEGVFEDIANGYAIGAYKTRANRVSDITTKLSQEVPGRMQELLGDYHKKSGLALLDMAKLHANFETIHPFQDGNGRVGQMILFKECLCHNMIPVLIRNENKTEYIRRLNEAQIHQNFDGLVSYFQEEQEHYFNETVPMIFDYRELSEIHPDIP